MSDIYNNAIDSLRIGIEHFLKEPGYPSRKHSILTLFHGIEMFLKERLYRTNPILIYRNIDTPISDDSLTVNIKEALSRLENLGLGLPKRQQQTIERLQRKRNRIEHHRYDQKEEDEQVIAEALQFILYFVEDVLDGKLEEGIPPETLREIQRIVFEHNQRCWIAMHRLEKWMHQHWPSWSEEEEDSPDEFQGTQDCPMCRQEFLVIGYHQVPFCFHCNTSVEAAVCDCCGRTHLVGKVCCEPEEENE